MRGVLQATIPIRKKCAEKYRNDSILGLSRFVRGIVHRYHKGVMRSQKDYEMGQGGPANAEYKRARLGEESHKRNQEAPVFLRHICIQDGSRRTGVNGSGMTCGPREREGLVPWEHKLFGHGFGGMASAHKRRRHRRRADLHAPIRRIWYEASVYTIHWES